MDVAKYIGLFLLKNKFVYVHGLGNLEIKKKPAKYDGEALNAPVYEVIMTPMGSIDDNLANFIATNEQISISKASNALREFSMQARAAMHSGQAVEIPGIGKFSEDRGKTVFTTDANFTHIPPPIPAIKYAKRVEEIVENSSTASPHSETHKVISDTPQYDMPTYRTDEQENTRNWGKIILWIAALLVTAALAFFGIRYMNNHNATNDMPLIIAPDTVKNIPVDNTAEDTAAIKNNMSNTVAVNASGLMNFEVVLNTYDAADKAQRRADKLKSYGNNVEMKAASDSSAFYVIMPLSDIAVADTARVLDSLRRNFNPNGVSIMK